MEVKRKRGRSPLRTSVYQHAVSGFPEEDQHAVRRIWWGYNSTYVVERKDGSRTWSLGSYYPGLSDYIRWGIKGCNIIKVRVFHRCAGHTELLTWSSLQALALDLVNEGKSWIIIFTNGEVAYTRRGSKSEDKFDHFEFEEFATRNFGCDFGLIEESKMEGTPRSSNPEGMLREQATDSVHRNVGCDSDLVEESSIEERPRSRNLRGRARRGRFRGRAAFSPSSSATEYLG